MGSAADFADLRICVVDDNRNFQNLFRTLLRGMGFRRVDLFADPEEAMSLIASTPVDVTFVDLVMPRRNGIDWVRNVRRTSRLANPTMSIALVSGHVDRRVLEAAVRAGVDDVLVKPLSPATLHRHLRRLVTRPLPYVRGSDGYFGPDPRILRVGPKQEESTGGTVAVADRDEVGIRRPVRQVPGLHVERRHEPGYTTAQAFLD